MFFLCPESLAYQLILWGDLARWPYIMCRCIPENILLRNSRHTGKTLEPIVFSMSSQE